MGCVYYRVLWRWRHVDHYFLSGGWTQTLQWETVTPVQCHLFPASKVIWCKMDCNFAYLNIPLSPAIGRTLIPRYFRSIFEGGATELFYVLKHPKESFHNNFVSLDCDQCTMVTQNGKPMFTQVILSWAIESWFFLFFFFFKVTISCLIGSFFSFCHATFVHHCHANCSPFDNHRYALRDACTWNSCLMIWWE